ncbi:PAP2 family protein [Methanobacterium aggregans]|uniref:PAP2 family protein n=1 Tax=Methanobacterium aggregans TaxID=1615586 RepID=UPI001AE3D5F2|nr:PAP2 family protein [Methanobacterium aggregans]MBP2046066.1 membrane-associated phospholipid phosphatase [Methanobacterium aggregans]
MEPHIASQSRIGSAKFISAITHPPLVSLPTFTLLNYFFLSFNDFLFLTLICAVFGTVLPITTVMLWINRKGIDVDITDRKKRKLPLIFAISSYLMGFLILYALGAPVITTALMFCYFSNTLIVLFITFFWKISLHAMGVAGPTAAMIYAFGYPGMLFGTIIPVVMWSRVTLKKHSTGQVMAGAAYGLVVTTIQLYLLIP